jgi:ABC-type amino acid transport substrate-binding protein
MAGSAAAAQGRIFISYRREDSAYPAGWLFDRLADSYGKGQIFKDVDNIEPGEDFVERITAAVGSCDVLLALIGPQWLTIADERGRRRIDSGDDFVRLEIEAALTREVLVIPILVDEARMPTAEELPGSLAKLVRRQALELSPNRFEFDTSRLLRVLDKTLAEAARYPRGIAVPVADQPPTTAPPITVPPPAPAPRKVGGAATATRRFQPRRRLRAWWLVAAALLAVLLLVAIVLRPQPSVAVPDPGGASVDAVVALLQQDGLVAVVTREANEKVAPGKLLRMAPSAGTKVRRGAAVTLFVSSGPTVTTLPPDRRELTVGFVDSFASSEDNPESYLQGLDPLLFTDPTGQLQGLDVDLAKALGDKLGVELEFQPLEHFTHSFRKVFEGRLDLGMSVLRDLERHQKDDGVDFVDYLDNGTVLLVPKDNPHAILSATDLCGRTIVRSLETAAGSILADSDRCAVQNRPRIVLMTCPTVPGAEEPEAKHVVLRDCPQYADPLRLLLGRQAHAAMVDAPLFEQAMKRTPAIRKQLEVAPVKMNGGRYGIAVDKDDRQVSDALQSALRAVMADGTYKRILAKWNLQSLALRTATVNGRP